MTSHSGSTSQTAVVVLALASAVFFAIGVVLQQRVASRTRDDGRSVDPGLLLKLVRRPLWLAGFAAVMAHFSLQASALGTGRLLVVEPVLASGLLFALPLSARLHHGRLTASDWWAALATAGGLALFVTLADPTGGRSRVPAGHLAVLAAIVEAVILGLGVLAARLPTATRALALGAAAGLGAAGTDSMTKTVANLAGSRHLGVFADPRLALLAVIGLTTYTLGQNAYRTAGLAACLPAQAVLQPMVGSVLGVIVYHERIHGGVGHIAGALVATGIAAWGIATLARSPLVHHVAPLEAALPVGPPAVDSLTLPR